MRPCHSRGDRGPARSRRASTGGDPDAFTALIDLTIARLDAAARLILRDPELARDAVQEALVTGMARPAGSARPRPVRCLAPSSDRQRLPRPRAPAGGARSRSRSSISTGRRPWTLSDGHRRSRAPRPCARRSTRQRAVVVLHYFLGLPMPEVARAHPMAGTAKSRPALRSRGDAGRPLRRAASTDRLRSPEEVGMTDDQRFERATCRSLPTGHAPSLPTETTSSGGPRQRRSGPPGCSPKGGSPWTSRCDG